MEVPRHCKRSCDLLCLSGDPSSFDKKFSGLSLLSPPTGHISETFENESDHEETPQKLSSTQTRFSCANCDMEFANVNLMRVHFKSAGHQTVLQSRYLRQVSDEDYNTLEELRGGSDEEEEEEEESSQEEEEEVTAEVERLELEEKPLHDHLLRHSKLYFRNADEEILAVHKCLLITKRQRPATLDELLRAAGTLHHRLNWTILMLSGGHFAGAIFIGGKMEYHKTFRRYTTRQKQGGTQSARDAQGGRIKSAGAGLRRKNESALTQEIQELLSSWRPQMDLCSHIFLRAPARKRGIFQTAARRQNNSNSVGPPFSSEDLRVRSIPITSKRPTMEEVKRVQEQLATVEVYDKDARLDFISMSDSRQVAQLRGNGGSVPPSRREAIGLASPSTDGGKRESDSRHRRRQRRQAAMESALDGSASSCEEPDELETVMEERDLRQELSPFGQSFAAAETRRPATEGSATAAWLNALYTGAVYGDAEAVALRLRQPPGDETSTLECLLQLRGSPPRTLLHDAVAAGSSEVVRLLLENGCRPDIPNQRRQMPYELASKEVRAVFRRFMAEFPDRYDYRAAKVPAPLTEEMETEKKAKQAERRKQQKAQKKNRQQEKKKAEKEKDDLEKEKNRFLELSDNAKNLEAKASGMRCFKCAAAVETRNRFEYYDSVFCSLRCLQAHKMGKR